MSIKTPFVEYRPDNIYVGIDPGLTLTGAVMVLGGRRHHWTFASKPSTMPDYVRIMKLAHEIVEVLGKVVDEATGNDSVTELVAFIERPVLGAHMNVHAAAKQLRLIQQIEAELFGLGFLDIREIGPTTAKKALTGRGDAKKIQMEQAAPMWLKAIPAKMEREALIDAYAMLVAGIGSPALRRINNGSK